MLDKQVKKQTTKKSKKDLDDKFLTPTKFSQEIERLVKTSGGLISYIEAVVTYCQENDIEFHVRLVIHLMCVQPNIFTGEFYRTIGIYFICFIK